MIIHEGVRVTASEVFLDDHVRSMVYMDNRRDLIIPVYVASFGNPIVYPKGANLMYPPIDDDGYLCNLPPSFQNVPKADTSINGSRHNQMSVGLFVKYGGNCTAQRKAEVIYEIQQYYPNVDMLLVYSTTPPPDTYDYDHQPTLLLPDAYPVSNIFDHIGILYVKFVDAIKINNEIKYQTKTTIYESTNAYFNPDPYINSTTAWSFNFFMSGQPDSYYDSGNGNTGIFTPQDNTNDENPINFFWFRFVLFGLLIIAPCIRAIYLWYAGGGRIYFRRHEQTGRIIGLQYIPPIASWLAIGPTRLQQSTPIRDVISEEEFNNLPEITYTEPLPIVETKHDVEEQSPIMTSSDRLCEEGTGNSMATSNLPHPLPVVVIDMDDNVSPEPDELNTSFNSAAEKGILGIVDSNPDNSMPTILNKDGDNYKDSKNSYVLPLINIGGYKSNIESNMDRPCTVDLNDLPPTTAVTTSCTSTTANTTTCTACSICIEDFIIGETLTLLPRCKHAFHKSCIRPWLMERQGCCPLCKTTVLPDEVAINLNNSIIEEEGQEAEEPSPTSIEIDSNTAATTEPTTR